MSAWAPEPFRSTKCTITAVVPMFFFAPSCSLCSMMRWLASLIAVTVRFSS